MSEALPDGLLLAYYGDDFTGSTDAMDAFTMAGVPTVLFLTPPNRAMLERFPGVRCVGLAGASRGRDPVWMETELAQAFDSLAGLGAPLLQYKICSTFDSSPAVGSIGCAIDIGVARMGGRYSPMIVGAPRLNRFQVFGNLFASVNGLGYRLDRHPTMSRHPVTPMGEADLRLHLGRQTGRRIGLVDFVRAKQGGSDEALRDLAGTDAPVVMIDVCDDETLRNAGRLIWEGRAGGPFTASSSGLQYALVAYWQAQKLLPACSVPMSADPVPVIAAVSGSCSPVTARQIACARDEGFHIERLDVAAVLDPRTSQTEIARAAGRARSAILAGASAIVCSAEGPDDPAVLDFDNIAARAGLARDVAARGIGTALAEVLRRLLDETGVRRVVVAGGDSSGEVAGALGIAALTVDAPLAPGAPLCRAWSDVPSRDGLQIVLKGGQMGDPGVFGDVRAGRSRGILSRK